MDTRRQSCSTRVRHCDCKTRLCLRRVLRPEDPVPKRGNRLWPRWAEGYDPADTSDSDTSDSETSSPDGGRRTFTASVMSKCKKLNRKVAYIVPKLKPSTGTVIYRMVYTTSSALPLLVPLSSKFASGGRHMQTCIGQTS